MPFSLEKIAVTFKNLENVKKVPILGDFFRNPEWIFWRENFLMPINLLYIKNWRE